MSNSTRFSASGDEYNMNGCSCAANSGRNQTNTVGDSCELMCANLLGQESDIERFEVTLKLSTPHQLCL